MSQPSSSKNPSTDSSNLLQDLRSGDLSTFPQVIVRKARFWMQSNNWSGRTRGYIFTITLVLLTQMFFSIWSVFLLPVVFVSMSCLIIFQSGVLSVIRQTSGESSNTSQTD